METGKMYEIILNYKSQMETRRDEINKYYISLFAALISFMPFIDKIIRVESIKLHNIRYISILLSCLGFVLSISWKKALERIHSYIKGTEDLLMQIEKDFDTGFISHMFKYLHDTKSPARVTRYQMLVPDTFIAIFVIIFIYSVVF